MINENDCQNRREEIAALVIGELEPKATEELRRHIESCRRCESLYQELVDEEKSIRTTFQKIAQRNESLQGDLIDKLEKSELTAVQKNEKKRKTIKIIWRTIMKSRVGKIAVAAAIIIAVITTIHFFHGPMESIAFADVVQPVLAARTASFDAALKSGDQPVQRSHFLCMAPGLIKQTMSNRTINIVNYKQNKALNLNPNDLTAKLTWLAPHRDIGASNILAQMQQRIEQAMSLSDKSVERLGRKLIDGQDAVGFRVQLSGERDYVIGWQGRGAFTVWADPETRLPVRLEWYDEAFELNTIATNIELDVYIDESVFSMDIPEGYTLIEAKEESEAPPLAVDEQKIIDGLQHWVELTGGTFPSSVIGYSAIKDIDPNADISFIQKDWKGFHGYVYVNLPSPQAFIKVMTLLGSGGLIGQMPPGTDWHYAGKGVKFGEAKTPIFWYRPKDAATYRVIYGDLAVKDVAPENLAK
jgi:outer membrane lipoprotein-sorting protein